MPCELCFSSPHASHTKLCRVVGVSTGAGRARPAEGETCLAPTKPLQPDTPTTDPGLVSSELRSSTAHRATVGSPGSATAYSLPLRFQPAQRLRNQEEALEPGSAQHR